MVVGRRQPGSGADLCGEGPGNQGPAVGSARGGRGDPRRDGGLDPAAHRAAHAWRGTLRRCRRGHPAGRRARARGDQPGPGGPLRAGFTGDGDRCRFHGGHGAVAGAERWGPGDPGTGHQRVRPSRRRGGALGGGRPHQPDGHRRPDAGDRYPSPHRQRARRRARSHDRHLCRHQPGPPAVRDPRRGQRLWPDSGRCLRPGGPVGGRANRPPHDLSAQHHRVHGSAGRDRPGRGGRPLHLDQESHRSPAHPQPGGVLRARWAPAARDRRLERRVVLRSGAGLRPRLLRRHVQPRPEHYALAGVRGPVRRPLRRGAVQPDPRLGIRRRTAGDPRGDRVWGRVRGEHDRGDVPGGVRPVPHERRRHPAGGGRTQDPGRRGGRPGVVCGR